MPEVADAATRAAFSRSLSANLRASAFLASASWISRRLRDTPEGLGASSSFNHAGFGWAAGGGDGGFWTGFGTGTTDGLGADLAWFCGTDLDAFEGTLGVVGVGAMGALSGATSAGAAVLGNWDI